MYEIGNRGPGRTPLDWSTRLKIAAGAARGLAFIHTTGTSVKIIHGNIKSTNILLDKSGNACVSDCGLSSFTPPTAAPQSAVYRAPKPPTTTVGPPRNSMSTLLGSCQWNFSLENAHPWWTIVGIWTCHGGFNRWREKNGRQRCLICS